VETTPLYKAVRDNLATPPGAVDDGALDIRLPRHATGGLNAYLDSSRLCRGFDHLRIDSYIKAALSHLAVKNADSVSRAMRHGGESHEHMPPDMALRNGP
jgi:hypothetical protein